MSNLFSRIAMRVAYGGVSRHAARDYRSTWRTGIGAAGILKQPSYFNRLLNQPSAPCVAG
jgi:hypothetical protein